MDRSMIEVQRTLQELYNKQGTRHGSRRVSAVTLLGSGYEADIYAFSIDGSNEGTREELVLRVYEGEGAADKAAHEFGAMLRLHAAGYPVPRVLTLRCDPSSLSGPFIIMERIHGLPMEWSPPVERRDALRAVFYQLLVQLHALQGSDILPDYPLARSRDPYACIDHELSFLAALLGRLGERETACLRSAFAWLESRRSEVPCARPAAIHGDFHRNNILMRPDGSAIVIDWSNIRLADCRSDIAWTQLLTRAAARPEEATDELRLYEQLSGREISKIELFEVAACMRQLLSVLISMRHGAARHGMRPEATALMRRDTSHIKHVAAVLKERTGIMMPELDDMLSAALG